MSLIMFVACAASKQPGPFYSRAGFGVEKADSLYAGVPAFEGDSLSAVFAIDLKHPNYPVSARKTEAMGTVYCQALIDEYGEVEAVYIDQSLNPFLDEAAIEAVKASKFRALREVKGRSGKYSLVIPFRFQAKTQ
jgi:TonB family protein